MKAAAILICLILEIPCSLAMADMEGINLPVARSDESGYVYAKSDIYVMPSISEPCGITALEAMASGTPVLLSKSSGAAEVTPHKLVVDFWDINGMAEKMVALLRYRTLSETLGQEELKDAGSITWDKVAEETIKVYEEAIAMRKP
jgi:glycogen(starch) synthase